MTFGEYDSFLPRWSPDGMDRLHFERAGFAATETDEELGRRAEAD
jgi:hypothetical protein